MDYLNFKSKQHFYTTTPPGFEVKLKNLLQMPTHPKSVRYSLPEPWLGFRFQGGGILAIVDCLFVFLFSFIFPKNSGGCG